MGLVWANVNLPSIKAKISLVFRDKVGGDELMRTSSVTEFARTPFSFAKSIDRVGTTRLDSRGTGSLISQPHSEADRCHVKTV